jgi:diphthamide biosynthesis protein 2
MLDSRDFHAPVITPFELEIALGLREWCGYSSSAFEDLLLTQSTTERVIPAGDGADADEPYFSLVSGTYKGSRSIESTPAPRAAIEGDTESKGSSGAGQLSTFVSPAAEFLKRREYRGLVLEEDLPVHEAVEGSSGIASDLGGV